MPAPENLVNLLFSHVFTDHDPVPGSLKFGDFDSDYASHPTVILAMTNLYVKKNAKISMTLVCLELYRRRH